MTNMLHDDDASLFATIVLTAVQDLCPPNQQSAYQYLGKLPKFSVNQFQLPDLKTFTGYLPTAGESQLSSQLVAQGYPGATPTAIRHLGQNLCGDVTGTRPESAVGDIQALFPDADLRQLKPIQELVHLVSSECPPINTYEADGLLSDLQTYLESNEKAFQQFQPPVLFGPTWTRVGPSTIRLTWSAIAVNGLSSYELWVQYQGAWTPLVLSGPWQRRGS